jgi:hypothetical protein
MNDIKKLLAFETKQKEALYILFHDSIYWSLKQPTYLYEKSGLKTT